MYAWALETLTLDRPYNSRFILTGYLILDSVMSALNFYTTSNGCTLNRGRANLLSSDESSLGLGETLRVRCASLTWTSTGFINSSAEWAPLISSSHSFSRKSLHLK